MNVAERLRRTPPADAIGTVGRGVRLWKPPIERREFWAVQVLVLSIAGGHALLEASAPSTDYEPVHLLPTILFLIPVVYAALNFGLPGAVPTALWSAALTTPNLILWHEGASRIVELSQVGAVCLMAVFVGRRVNEEKRARDEAERREGYRRMSEAKYRAIFDSVGEPILLLDDAGRIQEANAAAGVMFGRPVSELREASFESVAGPELADAARSSSSPLTGPIALPTDAGPVWIEPVRIEMESPPAIGRVQVMLRDVTLQHERQQGLEGYARWTLAAREEEQRRIARELHDGPLQSLVLLWRRLDGLDQAAPDHHQALAEARILAEQVADELRRFSRNLRPSVLDDLGLVAALSSEVAALRQQTGISGRFRVSGTARRLIPELELTLLRIAQEALRNVERHAAASNVVVHLAFRPAGVRLSIADDGRGLGTLPPTSRLLATGRLGLIGMQERARLAGGDFAIRDRRGGGTVVEVSASG